MMTSLGTVLLFMWRDLRGSLAARSLWVFCVSLFLGIFLIAACASMLQLVRGGIANQERELFGGDLQVSDRLPVTDAQLDWLQSNGEVSRLLELRTMLGTEDGQFTVVELQSVDEQYPLYGSVTLAPAQSLADAVSRSATGVWGAAFDPILAEQLGVSTGDRVSIGSLQVELRALIVEQPDRSLRADFRGPPVIVDEQALEESGLLQPGSLVDYDYRLRVDGDPFDWRDRLRAAFPDATWEVQTVEERGEFVGQRLDQVASVLLLIGFCTLLIGGLGVSNSIAAYLQTKYRTLATLQALGARARQIALVYSGQTLLLAAAASGAGALAGSTLAWLASRALVDSLPMAHSPLALLTPTLAAILFGVLSALAFALPTLGRVLNLSPAFLIRGGQTLDVRPPLHALIATAVLVVVLTVLLLLIVPQPWIGLAFVVSVLVLLLLLDRVVALTRALARRLGHQAWLDGRFALRMAVASLHRPGSAFRPMLLSLGSALTLLVASALVIAATVRSLNETVPERAPALVFYDIAAGQLDEFREVLAAQPGHQAVVTAPLVLGRLTEVNGERLSDSNVSSRALEANDEQKLSYRLQGIDNITVDRGEFWPLDYVGPPLVAMEDREADQIGLQVGDRLRFEMLGEQIDATLAAIYSQSRFETSFWLEAVFSGEVLDPVITRYIGSAYFDEGSDVNAMSALGQAFPNVVSIRTAKVLEAARGVLGSASLALALIALISLSASVLVMASVVAVNRQRQIFEASVLHAMGTRMRVVVKSVLFEYALLGVLLTVFASLMGAVLAYLVMETWLKIPAGNLWAVGLGVAAVTSALCLLGGAAWMIRTLNVSPAALLRRA